MSILFDFLRKTAASPGIQNLPFVGWMTMLTVILTLLIISCSLLTLYKVAPKGPLLEPVAHEQFLETQLSSGHLAKIRYIDNTSDHSKATSTVLFLHGFNGQISAWNSVLNQLKLSACPLRFVAIDLPGYGYSTLQPLSEHPSTKQNTFSVETQARNVVTILDQLKIDKIVLVGVSMGGSIAAALAAYYPSRVQKLFLLAPSGYPGSLNYPGPFGFIIKNKSLHSAAQTLAGSNLFQTLFKSSKAFQALSVTASYNESWKQALGKIQAPTTLLWSEGDLGVPLTYAEKIKAAIPQSTLVRLPKAVGHDIPNNSPEALVNLLVTQCTPPVSRSIRL